MGNGEQAISTVEEQFVEQQGFQGKSRWMLSEAPQDDVQESARKFDAGRARLDETAEIFKLALCDESRQV
ncbi:MAG: hypothetical protein HY290_19860 [Planctomycetia bacterium]|nr:hypothetical protein [Planctomycetia bacterium]